MRIFLRRSPLRATIICCLTLLQGHLLWLVTFHQHPLTAFSRGASSAVSQGASQPRAPVVTRLNCSVCQMVRHSLALPLAEFPVLHAAASVSRLFLFCPGGYHSYQASAIFGRAPPLC